MNDDFKNLLKLLDDDNEQLAGIAMAELISRADSRLDRVLRFLQESPDPKLRKRVLQLQSAITSRKRRQSIAEEFCSENVSLLNAVLYLHLLWYDNDTLEEITEQWNEFLREIGEPEPPGTLQILLARLAKTIRFYTEAGGLEPPEAMCLGTVLEENTATDYMGCIIGKLAADHWNIRTEIFSSGSSFLLFDGENMYDPRKEWTALPKSATQQFEFYKWSERELISLLSYSIFTIAVATDSFRYVHTLGCCIGRQPNIHFLPYPYGDHSSGGTVSTEKK